MAGATMVLVIGGIAIATLFRNYGMEFPLYWLIILLSIAWMYVCLGRVVPARLRAAGWNPLLALLFLAPPAGFVMLILLLVVPSKNPHPDPVVPISSLQTPK